VKQASILCVVAIACGGNRATAIAYPPAPRGDTVDDPYRWMEDMSSAGVTAWVDAENALADRELASIGGRDALHARIEELMRYERVSTAFHRGDRYFWYHRDGIKNQPTIESATALDGPATTVLDPNEASTDGSLVLAGFVPTHDGARFAYGLAAGGGDWTTWHVRDVGAAADLVDSLPFTKYYAPQFTRDGGGVYYARFPQPPAGKELVEPDHDHKVYFHAIGTPVAQDTIVYERPDHPSWQFLPHITSDARYLVIAIGDGEVGDRNQEQIAVVDLGAAERAKPRLIVDRFEFDYVFVGDDGSRLYFVTTAGAPKKRVVAFDVAAPDAKWIEIVPEGEDAIESATVAGRQLFVTTLHDAHARVAQHDLSGRKVREVDLPGVGSAFGFGGAGPDDSEAFYGFTSMTTPVSIYRYDIASGRSTAWRMPKVAFDPSAFETKQVFFPSKDGTKVPMFVTAKKGVALDGARPTLVTAYGFGGISSMPFFDPAKIAWLERGGVQVTVNVRGGGEYGEAWHHAAWRRQRQHGFDDFIAAGEWLVANGYTSRAHLGAYGVSGGGMLVGAVLVQRPDLFGAVVPIGGVFDLLRFQLFGEGAGWQGDLGSPDDTDDRAFLRSISPLHNARAQRYPAVFVVTSDHDVRVAPLHSYKFAAALQAGQQSSRRVLLRVQTRSGHGGGRMQSQVIDQDTEMYAFFARELGLTLAP
jgi:prolyl oligopeptidase